MKNTSVSLYNTNLIDFTKEKLFFGAGKNSQRFDVLKYPFLDKSNDTQQGFDWKHDEIPLGKDSKDYKTAASTPQKWVIDVTFQKLIFLDSVQGRGPVLIFGQIATLPELENVINVWQYFEGNKHSRTYTEILRSLYTEPDKMFDSAFEIEELQSIAKKIASVYEKTYQSVIEYVYKTQRNIEFTKEDLHELKKDIIRCLFEINALEGVRFYSSFAAIWAMEKSEGLFPGCSENLQFICRDENEHLALTQNLLKYLRKNEDEEFIEAYEEIKEELEKRYYEIYFEELDWINFLFKEGSYIGMNDEILKNYLNYLIIRRMKSLGINPTKEKLGGRYVIKNPLPWVDRYINMDKNEKLPQEEKILNYITGGIDQDVTEKEDVENIINKYI
jgi:ribonucleoside-diphosphate reductase beta chain